MDIALTPIGDVKNIDLIFENNDLRTDDGLRTAVLISLFTDARVSPEELPDGESDRRGFWGDEFNEAGDEIGSRLWLLSRRKLRDETRLLAEGYVSQALAWLKDDGIADIISVESEIVKPDQLRLAILIKRAGADRAEFIFDYVWSSEYGV